MGKVPSFSIGQHKKDAFLIDSFKVYFKCGHFTSFKNAKVYRVSSLSNNSKIIIPFFEKYPVRGDKYSSYILWKQRVLSKII